MSFSDLGLHDDLLRAVTAQGYTQPTPIQQQAIPIVLEGRDRLVAAENLPNVQFSNQSTA